MATLTGIVHVMCFIAIEVKINQFITLKIQLRIRLHGSSVLFVHSECGIRWESNFEIKLEIINFQYLMKIFYGFDCRSIIYMEIDYFSIRFGSAIHHSITTCESLVCFRFYSKVSNVIIIEKCDPKQCKFC